MYLKSLVLKGFKSFADRSVLALEPGMTVIVGPNGSGKSNISDAMLWVLGEQSAKHLRGQSMEDVIFSGSSARQAVGVAEVDLVLDNTDQKVPLEFDEIAITRRMYRSGESEYLVNGSPALLRDILDILHDSGIGRDAHSIISQGTLSHVLEARDDERRSLIEEAAGILKHRKRKERSTRRLAAMDTSLERVHDVSKEIDRQLRPLERQAKRAQQYKDLSTEMKDLELQLAVDDLRGLESVWHEQEKREREADADVELARFRYEEKGKELEKLQRTLQEKGLFVGDLAEQRRRCQSIMERLDSNMLLLEEKGNNMVARTSDLRGKIHRSQTQLEESSAEYEALKREQEQSGVRLKTLTHELSELGKQSEVLRKERKQSDDEYQHLTADLRGKQRAIDDCKTKIERYRNATSSLVAEDEMLSSRITQLDEAYETQGLELTSKRTHFDDLEAKLSKAGRDNELAKSDIDKRVRLLDSARKTLKKAQDRYAEISVEMKGIEEVDRALETSSPALSWIHEHGKELEGKTKSIASAFKVSEEYRNLVEHLLGADLFGLLVEDISTASDIAVRLMDDTHGDGEMSLLPLDARGHASDNTPKNGRHLIDEIDYDKSKAPAMEALLGDVWLVDDAKAAVKASSEDDGTHRFTTPDGIVVWPNGKITLGVQHNNAEGILARKDRFISLKASMEDVNEDLSEAEIAVSKAEDNLKLAQQDGFELSQKMASLQGEVDSLRSELARMEQSMTKASAERELLVDKRKALKDKRAQSQPLENELKERIGVLEGEVDSLQERIAAGSDDRSSRIDSENNVRKQISETNVEIATLSTRELYMKKRIGVLEDDIAQCRNTVEVSYDTQTSLDILSHRVDPLYHTLSLLSEGIGVWANKLRDQASLEQSDSVSLATTIEQARDAVRETKAELDAKGDVLGEVRVEKGKLETQVDAACKSIVETCGTPLEVALETPELANRAGVEERMLKVRRKIGSIGLVNQVAMEEYDALKKRRDYIQTQIDDLEEARRALTKIVAAIDKKMRNRFLETFDAVDANFQKLFSELFPGGNAHLALTEPDSPETSGVAVYAQPRGKRILKMSLMSGGEKSLTALALLFAVYHTRTVPFYVLDEVDTALDDTNLRRLVKALDTMRHETQFIIITHARRTMEMADVLYGISMQADGVSKVVSQKLERVGEAAKAEQDADPEELQEAIDKQGDVARAKAPAKVTKGVSIARTDEGEG